MRPRKSKRRPGRVDSIGLLKNTAALGLFRDQEFVSVAEAVMTEGEMEGNEDLVSYVDARIRDRWIQQNILQDEFYREYAPPTSLPGEFDLGETVSCPVNIPRDYLLEHLSIEGQTGSGKTSQIHSLVGQCPQAAPGVRVWLWDNDKRESRRLLRHREFGRSLIVARPTKIAVNPLEIEPDADPLEQINDNIDTAQTALRFPEHAREAGRLAYIQCCKSAGVFEGHLDEQPTIFHWYQAIRKTSYHEGSKRALLERLRPLLVSPGEEVFGYHRGHRKQEAVTITWLTRLPSSGPKRLGIVSVAVRGSPRDA